MSAHDQVIKTYLRPKLAAGEVTLGAALVRNVQRDEARLAIYKEMPPELVAYFVVTTQRIFVVRTELSAISEHPKPECREIVATFPYEAIERIETRGAFGGTAFYIFPGGGQPSQGFVIWDTCPELGEHEAISARFVDWFDTLKEDGFHLAAETPLVGPFAAVPPSRIAKPWRGRRGSGLIAGVLALVVLGAIAAGAIAYFMKPPAPPAPPPPPPPKASTANQVVDGGAPAASRPPAPPRPTPLAPAPPTAQPPARPGTGSPATAPPETATAPTPAGAGALAGLDENSAAGRIAKTGRRIQSSRADAWMGIAKRLRFELGGVSDADTTVVQLFDFAQPSDPSAVARIGAKRALVVTGGDPDENEDVADLIEDGGCDDLASCLRTLRSLSTDARFDDEDAAAFPRRRVVGARFDGVGFTITIVDWTAAAERRGDESVVVEGKRVLLVRMSSRDRREADAVAAALATP